MINTTNFATDETLVSAVMLKVSTLIEKRTGDEPCAEAEADLLHFLRTRLAAPQAAQAAVPEAREALAKRLIADVQVAATIATAACQRVAELPDRASPADWPEAMLVTGDELHMIVREAVIEAQTAPAHPAEGVPAQGGTPGPWRVRKRTNDVGEVLDCFVTAPDCQGRAYDAHILGDDYDSIDLKLADAELVVAAVNAFRATATQPAAQGMDGREFPPLTSELASILGLMCFQCIPFAQALRAAGHTIKTRAEDEQAAVLHWMLGHYFRHGEDWRTAAAEDMERMKAAARAAQAKQGGAA